MQRTTFAEDNIVWEMPDIRGVTTDPELLIKCVNIWRMSDFKGMPPDPHEVALMSTIRQEVVIMANYIDFIRDEPKRNAESINVPTLRDMLNDR